MNTNQKGFANMALIILVVVLAIVLGYVTLVKKPAITESPVMPPIASLPTTCVDQEEGTPVIISLSSYSGPIGTKLEINGCNFSGFEGDKNAWIENAEGVKGILYGEAGSTGKLLKVTLKSPLCQKDTSYSGLPCDATLALTPGTYRIYAMPWSKKSNEANFEIK